MTAGTELGMIEGFYGPLWPMEARLAVISQLASAGYGFYHYAPKADPRVREDWRRPYNDAAMASLASLREHCVANGMRFGVGLTPLGMELPGSTADYRDLAGRLTQLDELGIDELVVCFDDTYGSQSDLAERQAELVNWAAERTHARRLCVCPTYYSDDPLLDELFGIRPRGYLNALGRALDPAIDVYWAGPAICPAEIPVAHIQAVAEALDRMPLLWDNYPVNDGPTMAPYLHLRAPTGRPAALGGVLAGHAVNPALQPTLSLIPGLALAESYRVGDDYNPNAAFRHAAKAILGDALATHLERDLPELQDAGRDALVDPADLRARYAASDHRAAGEIVAWLDGAYGATDVPTQP